MNEKEEARQILMNKYQWSKEAIRLALNPTTREAKDRPFLRFDGEELTPEQANIVRFLRDEGWELPKIALALSVPDAQVGKLLYNRKVLDEMIKKHVDDNSEK